MLNGVPREVTAPGDFGPAAYAPHASHTTRVGHHQSGYPPVHSLPPLLNDAYRGPAIRPNANSPPLRQTYAHLPPDPILLPPSPPIPSSSVPNELPPPPHDSAALGNLSGLPPHDTLAYFQPISSQPKIYGVDSASTFSHQHHSLPLEEEQDPAPASPWIFHVE
jgi:hypothetical protein